ncbi:MAG: hypothetical protein JXL81_06860 [Deltaproteobacteria bacterium]|nr:hypothetical protein [Deltaproteobacteria bacterium]
MSENKSNKVVYLREKKDIVAESREIVGKLAPLSGSNALNMVLDHENPLALVQNMTKIDLFWLIKKVGEDDSYPLLSLASTEQWQYIMDMETWERDSVNKIDTFNWLNRLLKADPERLMQYLYGDDGNLLSHFFFSGILDIRIRDNDDFFIPEGFITFDNLYFIGIGDRDNAEDIEQLLRNMALYDHNRFQALMLGLQGTIPAEIEEEMYRLKGVRLAEEGYLPFEEAVSVYAHLNADRLKKDSSEYILNMPDDEDTRALVPVTPFMTIQEENLFSVATAGITDYLVLDRLRIEFAGLCNQIFSADGIRFESVDDLVKICKKAGGYLNAGLEKLSGGDVAIAQEFLKNHPLITIFRAGFSQALELRWKTERWIKVSWFDSLDLGNEFWGEDWAGILDGILLKKPLLYSEKMEKVYYRDFVSIDEIEETGAIIDRMIVLDNMLGKIIPENEMKQLIDEETDLTFYQVIFTFWIRRLCGLHPELKALSPDEAKSVFETLRAGEASPPYKMTEYKTKFIDNLSSLSGGSGENDSFLKDTLSLIWDEFQEEYAMIRTDDLEPRYSRFILIN